MADLIEKRSPQERLIIAKTLIESVLDDLPSAQPTQTNTPNALESLDCISRQAAVDALVDENIIDHMDTVHDSELHRCKRAIERILTQLPSTQPESTILKAIEKIKEVGCDEIIFMPKHGMKAWDENGVEYTMTPSAQPEIIRCKDCAKHEYCRTSTVWAIPPKDDWYCADAERGTDE